ncbi:MAG TPA: prepilin-type N-terminal cleavage/methylation domain-containing protein [Campylobacterales bacterium]|nr:prepilin-type N-terminal cleavage/methylation domain-containing protein [Campylobacterales bacterium]
MRSGFTLIELLVVLLLMTVVLSVTVPMGSKIFKQFQNYVEKIDEKHQLNQEQAYAFIEAKERTIMVEEVNYSISLKGVVTP